MHNLDRDGGTKNSFLYVLPSIIIVTMIIGRQSQYWLERSTTNEEKEVLSLIANALFCPRINSTSCSPTKNWIVMHFFLFFFVTIKTEGCMHFLTVYEKRYVAWNIKMFTILVNHIWYLRIFRHYLVIPISCSRFQKMLEILSFIHIFFPDS